MHIGERTHTESGFILWFACFHLEICDAVFVMFVYWVSESSIDYPGGQWVHILSGGQ